MNSPITDYLNELMQTYAGEKSGKVADYIPELSHANPDSFGISIVTCNGMVYEVGDSREEFTIQSISKALTYGIALEDNGLEQLSKKVGVEPTGDAFNSISLDPESGKPANPMINAGAIATTGMVVGETSKQKTYRILDAFSRYVGRKLEINDAVYQSESSTGHRNRAISHLLRNFEILEDDPEAALDAYFKQCSIMVNCTDLGVIAATLANNGINPITGKRAIIREYVESVLGVMSSCGMYDFAGNGFSAWACPQKVVSAAALWPSSRPTGHRSLLPSFGCRAIVCAA